MLFLLLLAGIFITFVGSYRIIPNHYHQHSTTLLKKNSLTRLFVFKPFYIKEYSRRVPILVHEKETELLPLLQAWSDNLGKFDPKLFQSLLQQKKIFPAGKNNMDIQKIKDYYGTKSSTIQQLKKKFAPVNVYVNQGTLKKPVLVKLSTMMNKPSKQIEPMTLLIQKKEAYKNITQLFEEEKKQTNHQQFIQLVNNKLPIGSKPWLNWAAYQHEQGEYTLKHAIVEYLSPYSDVTKGENPLHRRKAGVVGTQAIGDGAIENDPLNELPKRIMHPWPAFQEVYFNCRWANPHPNIIAPPVWVAKMDMSYYRVNDRIVKNKEDGLIMGGDMMTWWDALKIAAYGHEGDSRDESYQLPHATAHIKDPPIPFYNPVHKSNIPDSHEFPFDEIVYEILGRKLDYEEHEQLSEIFTDEIYEEENIRKQKLQSMGYDLTAFLHPRSKEDEIQEELRQQYNVTVKEVLQYFNEHYVNISEIYQQDLSQYDLIQQLNLSDQVIATLPNKQLVWNYFHDGRPDRIDRVLAKRRTKNGGEELITWSYFNETFGAKVEQYLQSIEQYYYDSFRKDKALEDPKYLKADRSKDEIVNDFVARIGQYRAMMALNPNKREQQRRKRMALVKPSIDPSRSYFAQYAKQPLPEVENSSPNVDKEKGEGEIITDVAEV